MLESACACARDGFARPQRRIRLKVFQIFEDLCGVKDLELSMYEHGDLALGIDAQDFGVPWTVSLPGVERDHDQFEIQSLLERRNLHFRAKHAQRPGIKGQAWIHHCGYNFFGAGARGEGVRNRHFSPVLATADRSCVDNDAAVQSADIQNWIPRTNPSHRAATRHGRPGCRRPADETAGLEVITVTAQKVSEDLQKSAAAITAISGDELVAAGVHDIREAQNLMPSVRFQAENASTEIYIRGVGSTLDLPNIEPPTAFNFNGVYIPREGTSVGLFDIAQLELLPGPQGTLYGRATLGGAVNVEFNRPTREMESSGVLEVGDDSLLHGTFVQNLPVNESLALRGAFDYSHQDGYQRTGADAKDDAAGRLSALYEPNEELDVYFWMHGARKDGDSPNLVRRGYNDGTFDGDPEAYDHDDPWNDTISADAPTASPQDYENFVTGAQVDWDLGDMTLTYLPSYFYLDWSADYWLEDIPALLTAHYNQLTQEVRLASDGEDRLQWLGGLYAYRVNNDGDFLVGGFPLAQVSHNRLDGWALFGEATYALTDSVRVTAGGRSSWDHREGEGTTAFGQAYSADEKYDHIDWKLGVEADVGGASMLYGTIQTGYQPGTYNLFPSTPEQSNLVRSATLTAYTVGHQEPLSRRPAAGQRRGVLLPVRRPAGAVVQPEHGAADDVQRRQDRNLRQPARRAVRDHGQRPAESLRRLSARRV